MTIRRSKSGTKETQRANDSESDRNYEKLKKKDTDGDEGGGEQSRKIRQIVPRTG